MPLKQLLRRSLTASIGLFVLLAIYEVLFRRPGLGAPEELGNLALIEQVGSSWRWWLRFGGGAWSRGLETLCLAGPWPWQAIYGYNALALGLLGWGLWRWGRLLGGESGALMTLVLAFSAPFTWLQSRTTFAYVLLPGAALWIAWQLRQRRGTAWSLGLGSLLALACLDYDAWLLAVPALLLAWAASPKEERARVLPLSLGLLAGLALLAWLNHPYQAAWTVQRASVPSNLILNLRSYFFGGTTPKAMGLETWPSFPLLAWPGLLLMLGRGPAWLWAWAALGLLGLVPGGPLQEPNRAILAWPALLLLSALGWARFLDALRNSYREGLLVLALLAAPLLGYAQFDRIIRVWDEPIHGLSRRLMDAAGFLRSQPEDEQGLALRLDDRDTWALARFSRRPLGTLDPAGWVLMPPDLADPQDARWGRWQAFGDPTGKRTWLLQPSAAAWPLLLDAARSPLLQTAYVSVPEGVWLERLRARSAQPRSPLQASVEEAQRVQTALRLAQLRPEDTAFSLAGPQLSRYPLQQLQGALAGSGVAEKARLELDALQRPGERWRRARMPAQ